MPPVATEPHDDLSCLLAHDMRTNAAPTPRTHTHTHTYIHILFGPGLPPPALQVLPPPARNTQPNPYNFTPSTNHGCNPHSTQPPQVQKVTEAVALVKQQRQDIKVEGPIQYDAAIDPAVAAVKVKGGSEVAGRATVFVFPDLNTGARGVGGGAEGGGRVVGRWGCKYQPRRSKSSRTSGAQAQASDNTYGRGPRLSECVYMGLVWLCTCVCLQRCSGPTAVAMYGRRTPCPSATAHSHVPAYRLTTDTRRLVFLLLFTTDLYALTNAPMLSLTQATTRTRRCSSPRAPSRWAPSCRCACVCLRVWGCVVRPQPHRPTLTADG